jgi:hypothetical protein
MSQVTKNTGSEILPINGLLFESETRSFYFRPESRVGFSLKRFLKRPQHGQNPRFFVVSKVQRK